MTRHAVVVIALLVVSSHAFARPSEFDPHGRDKTKPPLLDPGGVPSLPGFREVPPPEKVPRHLAQVHASYRYRVPPAVASEAGFSATQVRLLERHVAKLRARTPYLLTRWSGMVRKDIPLSKEQEARLHWLILEWESENANLRIRNKYGRLSDRRLADEMMLNNERLLAAVQAEISEAMYQRLVMDLRYPHE